MRLETGATLPARARRLLWSLHLALLALAVLAVVAWLPEGAGRLPYVSAAVSGSALLLWGLAGLYCAGLFAETTAAAPTPGLGAALAVALLASLVALQLAPGWGALLMLAAHFWLALCEHLPSQAQRWPAAWRQARRQQTQLLGVVMVSVAVAALTIGQQY